MRKNGLAILIAMSMLLPLLGCGQPGEGRTAEEWLSLAYSGLAAKDEYGFSGSFSMRTADGVAYRPQTFEGKIAEHNQLTLQSEHGNQPHFNPVQVLDMLRQEHAEVKLAKAARRDKQITLIIKQKEKVSTARWSGRLRAELAEVENEKLPGGAASQREEIADEMNRAKQQLEQMLDGMQASSYYEVVIDRASLLPVTMEENTDFRYTYKGRAVSESRHTSVRLQSFDET